MSINFFKSKKAIVIYCLLAILILIVVASKITPIAEYIFARGISLAINFILSAITYILPFSLYECFCLILILTFPPFMGFIVYLLVKKQYVKKIVYSIFLIAICTTLCYTMSYGALYNRYSALQNFEIYAAEVNEKNLCSSIEYYMENTIQSSRKLQRLENSNIANPYSSRQLADIINNEYNTINNGFLYNYNAKTKNVMWSDGLSFLRISGIYFPFTGEANINTNTQNYELPVIMAHEIAHARGVSLENQANMLAYYICMNSQNEYLKYSGNLVSTITLLSSLKKSNHDLYIRYKAMLPKEILLELDNDYAEYAKYQSFLGDISRFFNNIFLQSNGVENGTMSYGQTVSHLVYLGEMKKW